MKHLCDSIETLAMALNDGELAGDELRDVEVHLTECDACREHTAAQATAIGSLRRKLAAPPAPELLRARVMRGLDTEDRAARKPVTSWLLPAGSVVAAAAALALFVTSAPSNTKPSVTEMVANKATASRPLEVQGASTGEWVQQHYEPGVALPTFGSAHVERWGARLADVMDRDAVQLYYRVTTDEGISRDLQVMIFDARGIVFGGQRVEVNERPLLVGVIRGISVVTYRDGRDRAYVFTSTQLTPGELTGLVGSSSLLMQLRDDERWH